MSSPYPQVPLGEVVRHRKEFIEISDDESYKRCRVQLHAKGVVLRDLVGGPEIKTKRQQVCRADDFLVAEIDAKSGGYGIVPPELAGSVVSSHYFLFEVLTDRMDVRFLNYCLRRPRFHDQVVAKGSTNYAAVRPADVVAYLIPLPRLDEQRRIVAWIEALAGKIEAARGLRLEAESEMRSLLVSVYHNVVEGCAVHAMADVAPLVRRPQDVKEDGIYHELGIRSFGRGTFHKPSVSGLELGTKRIFRIQHNDLLFNIVFAWEGAVAVASTADDGRVGSHRFLACVPQGGIATPRFLAYHFLTDQGLASLGEASPGGAGRNRTLGLKALEAIQVPVPDFGLQLRFDKLLAQTDAVERLRSQATAELDALLPSVLERAFSGGL